MRQITVNMAEEVNRIRDERLPEIEQGKQDLVEQFEEEYESYKEVPSEEEAAFDKLEEKRIELEGRAETFEHYIEEWNGSKFVIRELDTGAVAAIQDEVSEKSFEFDLEQGEIEGGTPKQGYGMVETLRRAIAQQPEGAPTKPHPEAGEQIAPGQYPHQVGMWLYEKINNFNAIGEAELGNSSLREEMTS